MSKDTQVPTLIGLGPNIKYLTEVQVAKLLCLSRKTLQKARYEGTGIPFIRIGKRAIRYRVEEVEAYLEACRLTTLEKEA